MIVIVPLNGEAAEIFESYKELFEHILSRMKIIKESNPRNLRQTDWCFTIHPHQRVRGLYADTKNLPDVMKEAFEYNLPLIEICAGDSKHPLYIVLTPNVNLDYLKKKWCIDWCTYHHVLVREV